MLLSLTVAFLGARSDFFPAPAPTPLYVQRATVDITPDESLPLGGYSERGAKSSITGGDHLFARCILFHQGDLKVAVVSAEMLTIPESLYAAVQAVIPKDTKLFLSATHTHCAPDSQMLNDRMTFAIPGIATFRRRWLKWYSAKISTAVVDAEKASPLKVENIDSATLGLNLNRGRREGAAPDKTATLLRMNRNVPLLFSYAAHPVFYGSDEMHFRGDWPGAIAQSLGCAVLQGAIGDVSPNFDGGTPAQRIEGFTAALSAVAQKGVVGRVWNGRSRIEWNAVDIKLDPTSPHPDFIHNNHLPAALADELVRKFAPPKAQVFGLRLGSLAIIGIPGEPTSHLGKQIQSYGRKLGFSNVLVISHVNGWIGYILDSNDYPKGGYEATLSFYGRDNGNRVVEAARGALLGLSMTLGSRSRELPPKMNR